MNTFNKHSRDKNSGIRAAKQNVWSKHAGHARVVLPGNFLRAPAHWSGICGCVGRGRCWRRRQGREDGQFWFWMYVVRHSCLSAGSILGEDLPKVLKPAYTVVGMTNNNREAQNPIYISCYGKITKCRITCNLSYTNTHSQKCSRKFVCCLLDLQRMACSSKPHHRMVTVKNIFEKEREEISPNTRRNTEINAEKTRDCRNRHKILIQSLWLGILILSFSSSFPMHTPPTPPNSSEVSAGQMTMLNSEHLTSQAIVFTFTSNHDHLPPSIWSLHDQNSNTAAWFIAPTNFMQVLLPLLIRQDGTKMTCL